MRWVGRWLRAWLLLALGLCSNAWAQSNPVKDEPAPVQLERNADGLWLSARLPLQLPPGLEDALRKGVPLHFVWQAEVLRSRWYWWDQKMLTTTRSVRLAYQPLTRRWRVSTATGEFGSAAGNALHQNLDNLSDALAAVFRVSGWQLAEAGQWDAKPQDKVRLKFQLDQSLLPKPFQLGLGAANDTVLGYEVLLNLPASKAKGEGDE